jgi:hypothetical protein
MQYKEYIFCFCLFNEKYDTNENRYGLSKVDGQKDAIRAK